MRDLHDDAHEGNALPCLGPDGRPMSAAEYEAHVHRLDAARAEQRKALGSTPLLMRKAGSRGPWKLRAPRRGSSRSGRAPARPRPAGGRARRVDGDDGDPPPPPLLVHQRTAHALLGLTRRAFLATVKRHGIPHTIERRLYLCRLADVLAALGLGPQPAQQAPEPRVPWQERARLRLVAGGRGAR